MGQASGFGLGEGRPRLRRGLRVTHLGDERLVLDPVSGVVHTVRGVAVRELDQVLTADGPAHPEVLASLVASGIVEVPGLSRRQALALSSSAAALVLSASLPSAVAAASGGSIPASGDGGSVIEFTLSSPSGAMLYRLANEVDSPLDTTYRLTLGVAATVDVLLVAGGGAGGTPGSAETAEFFGGGGGGGEVAYIGGLSLAGGSVLDFRVAGLSSGQGNDTSLTIGSDTLTVKGGGVGARRDGSTLTNAASGGSGGGGTSRATERGNGVSTAPATYGGQEVREAVSDGGLGTLGHQAGSGGGGASTAGVNSTSTGGGDGGDGVELGSYTGWLLGVTSGANPADYPTVLGSGGGGAGLVARGTSDAADPDDEFDFSGRGGGRNAELDAVSGRDGRNGAGSGGGGGIRFQRSTQYPFASSGNGASGVVWIRTQLT